MRNKKIKIVFIVISICAFAFIVVNTIRNSTKNKPVFEARDVYYERYSNIHLSGKIINKISIDNDRYSTYYIDVASSNTKLHDLRDSVKYYFLVIHGDSAKMVYAMSYDIFVNDSVDINYKTKEMSVYRKGEKIGWYEVPSFSDYYLERFNKVDRNKW